MEQQVLNKYEADGLPMPFVIPKSGQALVTATSEPLSNEIAQMAMIIFETMHAVGSRIKLDSLEIYGVKKGVLLELEEKRIIGSIFEATEHLTIDSLRRLLIDLKEKLKVEKPPEVKPKAKLDPAILDQMRITLKEYLGDFSERTYQNQFKLQRIRPEEFYEEDARRFIFTLGKAAGMIIGPSKGSELTKKMLTLLK